MKYSVKAIGCCLSKGVLILTLVGSALVGGGLAIKYTIERHNLYCATLKDTINTSVGIAFDEALAKYKEDCLSESQSSVEESSFSAVFLGLALFAFVSWMMFLICAENITYCQVAVDTKRRPWYWLPKKLGGNPLPAKKFIKCNHCGESKLETDEQYRNRMSK